MSNATTQDVQARVIAIVSDIFDKDPSELTPSCNFYTDLGADSLDMVDVAMEIEDAFEISVPDEESQKIQTLADVITCVQTVRSGKDTLSNP
jgi:acyl carrier protein